MAQRLLLVNPTRTRAKSLGRKKPAAIKKRPKAKRRKPMAKRRTAAQKAATRKMIAANRRRRAPTRAARKAPAKRKRRVRRNPATKASQRRTYSRTATMNPRKRRRIRRNPTGRINLRTITNDLLMPAATGAVGAIANDALFTYLPLPVQFKTPGFARYASKAVTAIAMTWLAGMVVQKKTAMQLGVGALTTLTAEIAREFMVRNVPALAPAAMEGMGVYTMGYYNPATPAGGGMGVYVPGAQTQQLPSLASRETPGVAPMAMGQSPDGYNY